MTALTKAELCEELMDKLFIDRTVAKDLVDAFFKEIKSNLGQGEPVKLSSFGNFELRDKKERPGRNPRTGEVIPVSARRVVTFKPGLKLRLKIEEKLDNPKIAVQHDET